MVALVLASEALRKFGGDSLDRVRAQPRRLPRVAPSMRSDERTHLVLIGLMGAGKTTVGRACAARLGPRLRRHRRRRSSRAPDARSTRSSRRWRAALSRARARRGRRRVRVARRRSSSRAAAARCSTPRTGAGLRDAGVVVWLRAPVSVLAARVGDGSNRAAARAATRRSRSTRLERAAASRAYEATARRDGRHRGSRRRRRSPTRCSRCSQVTTRVTRRSRRPQLRRRRRRRRTRRARDRRCRAAVASPSSPKPASPTCRRTTSTRRCRRAAVEHDRSSSDDGEDAKTLATVDDLCRALRAWGLLRGDARRRRWRGRRRRHRGFRRVGVLPRRRRRAGADHAAGDGRRRDRRQDRRQPARGQEPGRRVPPAARGVRQPGSCSRRCPTGSTAAAWARSRSTR